MTSLFSRAYAIKFEKENLNVQSVTDGEAAIDYLKKNEARIWCFLI